jgi:GNAT superfamily N-acetyltransferase
MFTIAPATARDRDLVLGLVERLLRELEDSPGEFDGVDRAGVLRGMVRAGDRFASFLARTPEGEAAGVVTVVESFAIYAGGDYGVIDELYVVPEFRSRGVGRLLIEAVKMRGRERGWLRVDVTAPPEKRWARTVKFYESQGFVFTGPKLRCMLGGPRKEGA